MRLGHSEKGRKGVYGLGACSFPPRILFHPRISLPFPSLPPYRFNLTGAPLFISCSIPSTAFSLSKTTPPKPFANLSASSLLEKAIAEGEQQGKAVEPTTYQANRKEA